MLLPALNRAREQARKTACANNLKSMSAAFQMHINGNDCMLILDHVGFRGCANWKDQLAPDLGVVPDPKGMPYAGMELTRGVFRCPMFRERIQAVDRRIPVAPAPAVTAGIMRHASTASKQAVAYAISDAIDWGTHYYTLASLYNPAKTDATVGGVAAGNRHQGAVNLMWVSHVGNMSQSALPKGASGNKAYNYLMSE